MAWAPDYGDTDEAEAWVRVDDHVDSDELDLIVSTSSRAIDDHCNRQFGKVDAVEHRFYTPWWDYERGRWVVDIDDLMTTTDAVVTLGGETLTDYVLEPRNAAAEGKPWTRLVIGSSSSSLTTGEDYDLDALALWGWTAVPNAVRTAWRLQTSRLLSRRDSPYGVAGSPQDGSELRLLSKLDPDVAVSLRGFRRPRATG